MSIDVSKEVLSVETVEEFDAIVERMKISHPLKYEARLASGDLAKQRALLKGGEVKEEEVKEEKVEGVKEEKPKKVK